MANGVRQTESGVVQTEAGVAQTVLAAAAALMEDFETGDLSKWDRVDTSWGTSTTHAYEGTYGAHSDNTSGSQQSLVAAEGSLDADFAPGQVWHLLYKSVTGDSTQIYFGKQDTSKASSTYIIDFRVFAGQGGVQIDIHDGTSRSGLSRNWGNIPIIPAGGEWGHIYFYWDPPAGDPHDADADPTGDFLMEVQDDNGVPKLTAYFDTTDSTYRSGGVGISHNDGNDFAYDLLEVADSADAFDTFDPTNHFQDPGEIHFFKNGDLGTIDNAEGMDLEIVGPARVSAARGDFCLAMNGSAATFDDSGGHSAPGAQAVDLPNYLPDGQKGRCFARTTRADEGEVYVGCASVGSGSDYLRVELDWSQDRLRGLEVLGGSNTEVFNVTNVGWVANTWYETVLDRTTSGDVTVTVYDDSDGTQMASATHTLDSTLVGNDGILLIGGYNNTTNTPDFFVDHWENLS